MSEVRQPSYQTQTAPATPRGLPAKLWSVVYRSRAATPLSGYELYQLVQAAQARNASESITGMLLHDEGMFYQWLEGPAEGVARVMKSIIADPRHRNVEILSDKLAGARQFADWTMRLASRGARSIHSVHNVIVPSREALDDLLQNPDHIPAVLAGFSPVLQPSAPPSNYPLGGAAGKALRDMIVTAVIPRLVARHQAARPTGPWPIDARARALADLLAGPDTGAALELLRTLHGGNGATGQLYETVVEPAARALGDLWSADLCSELDVTFGLAQLQRALRILNEDELPPLPPVNAFIPAVLIVPEPGEIHSLNAALDSDALFSAGWDPQSEYPASDEALQDFLSGQWFDALDLSLSPSFRRDHWLPRVTKTIALARHASRNKALVVVVAGRIFSEDSTAGAQVGADGTSATALRAERTIRDGLNRLQAGD